MLPGVPAGQAMDRDFIARNQIVERYIGGRLPLKGAQDFERFCRENPQLLDEITCDVSSRAAAARSGGRPRPGSNARKHWWEQLPVLGSALRGLLALALAVTSLVDAQQAVGARSQHRQPAAASGRAATRSSKSHAPSL